MPEVITVEILGLKELEKKMLELGPKLARSGLRYALNAGAQVIKKETLTRAPELTGKLKRAVYVARAKEEAGPAHETYIVSVRHGRKYQVWTNKHFFSKRMRLNDSKKDLDAFYWKFLEFGTKFLAARPFLRPAFESKKHESVNQIKQKLFERLEVLANR